MGGKLRGEEADEFMVPNGAWEIPGEPYVLSLGLMVRLMNFDLKVSPQVFSVQ